MSTGDETRPSSATATGTPAAPAPAAGGGSGDAPGRLPLFGTASAVAPPAAALPASVAGEDGETKGTTAGSAKEADADLLMGQVIETLRTVYDPEIPVNIYELGMIYDVKIEAPATVLVKMTLTSPSCPVAGSLPGDVQLKVQNIPGVASAKVDLVWEPPWNPSLMSDAAKLELGMF